MPAIDFVLEGFESTVTLSALGTLTPGVDIPELTVDATAELDMALDDVVAVFSYQSDDWNMNDVSASDVGYIVNSIFPAFNAGSDAIVTLNPIGTTEATGENYPDETMRVKHDYVRHLAESLFGTRYGVDLFNNVEALQEDVHTITGNGADCTMNVINTLMGSLMADGVKHDDDESNTNICRALFQQMIKNQPARFNVVDPAVSTGVPLPFEAGDSISFKLIINAADGQEDLTGAIPVPVRSYRIKINLTA